MSSNLLRVRELNTSRLLALVALVACTHVENLSSASTPMLASIHSTSSQLPGDGDTTEVLEVVAKPAPDSSSGLMSVLITTDLGTFVESGLDSVREPLDRTGTLRVTLRAPLGTGVAALRATDGLTSVDTSLTFTQANPDTILVVASSLVVLDTSATTITAILRRARGVPTPGDTAHFAARDSLGNEIGSLGAPSLSDSSGRVILQYSPASVGFSGTVTISGSTIGRNGNVIVGQVRILVLPP